MDTDTSNTTHETQFVLRRLEEALRLFGHETDPHWFWILVLVIVLAVGFVYVGWMYKRDSQSVGWGWASFLALLRCCVYGVLAAVFLLPALQTWERTELHSKVVLGTDVSGSMGNRDGVPSETMPVEKLPTRQDQVIGLLSDERTGFLKSLQEKNPVYVYRFGGRADEQFKVLEGGKVLSTSEWADWLKPDANEKMPEGLSEDEKAKFQKRLDLHKQLVNGTNIAEALTEIMNREANNMVQGIVVFSDGRSTQLNNEVMDELKARARRAKIPIFTVAVGEYRQPISIANLTLQAPEQARPDDKFLIRVEVDGEGLANRESVTYLDITGPKGDKRALDKPFKFNSGTAGVPHAQAEFEIDAAALGVAPVNSKKPELEEGDYIVQARVPKDKREIFIGKEHVSDKATVHVVKKPLRVLLFAGGPTRDYQYVRTMLVREVDAKRAELSIYLQTRRDGVVQDVPAERLLKYFPNRIGEDAADVKSEDRYYNLSQYDLIITFDPNWGELPPETLAPLEKWVDLHAGGLILVAGPINTYQLAAPTNRDTMKPILKLFPVILQDSRLLGLGGAGDRPTSEPWRLNFPGANAEMEFLKLDEEGKDPLAGWEEFFTGLPKAQVTKETPVIRGFYSYYPVEDKKASAVTIATFSDPRARLKDGNREQPFLVSMPYGSGKVVYIGSGELWRLRQYRESFLERFWTKLFRYAGSGNMTRLNSHGKIYMAPAFSAGQFVTVKAKLFGRDMLPLSQNARPKIQLKPPAGVTMPTTYEMAAEPATQGAEWAGWFAGRFRALAPGQYQVDLQIPESGETISQRFLVKESNPELDNTRPDFGQLYQLASEVTDFLPRMDKSTQEEIKDAVDKTAAALLHHKEDEEAEGVKRDQAKDKARAAAKQTSGDKAVPRLFFDLTSAHLIPKCMVTESKVQRSRGPVKDLWDLGFTVSDDPRVRMATVLIIVTVLLSVEWLTRKLLRLA